MTREDAINALQAAIRALEREFAQQEAHALRELERQLSKIEQPNHKTDNADVVIMFFEIPGREVQGEVCSHCEGKGRLVDHDPDYGPWNATVETCGHCKGTGRVPPKKKVKVVKYQRLGPNADD